MGALGLSQKSNKNWTDPQPGRPDWDGNSHSYLLHQTEHRHLYFSGLDPIFISNHSENRATTFEVQLPHLNWAEIPFRGVSEEVAANFGSIRDDGRIVKKRFVPDLHLEELLVSGRELLGPGAEGQQQQQQQEQGAAQREHPTATTGSQSHPREAATSLPHAGGPDRGKAPVYSWLVVTALATRRLLWLLWADLPLTRRHT